MNEGNGMPYDSSGELPMNKDTAGNIVKQIAADYQLIVAEAFNQPNAALPVCVTSGKYAKGDKAGKQEEAYRCFTISEYMAAFLYYCSIFHKMEIIKLQLNQENYTFIINSSLVQDITLNSEEITHLLSPCENTEKDPDGLYLKEISPFENDSGRKDIQWRNFLTETVKNVHNLTESVNYHNAGKITPKLNTIKQPMLYVLSAHNIRTFCMGYLSKFNELQGQLLNYSDEAEDDKALEWIYEALGNLLKEVLMISKTHFSDNREKDLNSFLSELYDGSAAAESNMTIEQFNKRAVFYSMFDNARHEPLRRRGSYEVKWTEDIITFNIMNKIINTLDPNFYRSLHRQSGTNRSWVNELRSNLVNTSSAIEALLLKIG